MAASFDLDISYSQIAVFDPKLTNPFNDWSSRHTAQGFSWRPYSVSFGTLEGGGTARVDVHVKSTVEVADRSVRAIFVPFAVKKHDGVEIASISAGQQITIPHGSYGLLFETAPDSRADMWIQFTFVKQKNVQPEILRADPEIVPGDELLMEATPA